MSTNIDNRLHKSNDTPSMSLKSALSLGSESESARTVSMNKAATTTYLNSLSYEQDDVGDSLSRSMNKLNQSLSQAASANHESAVDEQAEKMAVYSKLAGKLIDRDSSLQEKVAQDLSKNSNIVRTKDASESLQKAMGNLPSALKEGTQAGKDLAKFMVENLVTLSDRKQMGAGLERDLAVRQINIPKSQPNSRLQNASSKVLSASIEYVKNNQPEVLTKIAAQEASQAKAQSQAALASETMNSAKSTDNSDAPDSTYLSALKAQRAQQNKTQAPDTSTKPSAPQDKISAEISKRIHNLIAQAAQTAKSGNLINLSPEEAERFDRTITSQNQQAQVKGDPLERILSNTSVNAADGELPPPSKQTPEANVRQLSLSELSARASKLQSQFRQERMRIVQEGKLPDPAQMPETNFDKDSIKATIDASKQQQESVQNQQRASHTSSLYESLARARSAFSAHNITSEAAAQEQPATTESKPAPQTTEQKPATQADSKPLTSESKPVTTESKPAPQTTEQKPAAQADSKPLTSESKPATTESKPAPQTTEQKPATQADSKPLTSESKPATTESKPAPQTTEQKPATQADSKPLTSESKPVTTESKPAPQTTEQKPAAQADSKPLTSESKPVTTESKPAPQSTEQKPAAQADSKPLTSESKPVTTESKPAPQTTEQKPATQADSKPLTSESKPVTTESKPAPQSTEQKPAATADSKPTTLEAKPNNFGSTSVNLSFNAIQSSSYGGMDIMPGMTIPVSHFGNLDNDTIQPNQKALEALKLQARLLEAQISSAEQELLKSKQVTESTNKPVENLNTPKAPVSDGDEALTQQQVSKPSIVPNGDSSKAPVADGDEALTQQQVSKPSIVPSGDTSKAPVADGEEALTQQQVSKPSIVPSGDASKAPVADGDEALVQQQGAKPGVMSGGADAEIEESLIVPKPNVVVEGEAEFVAKEPSASMPNVAGSVPTPSDKAAPSTVGKGNLYAKLYGAMQQGHYEDAHIQQPTVSDKSTQSAQSNLGFNSELAKPMGSSSSSIAGAGALNGMALTEDAEITLEDGEPNTSNLVAKEQAKGPAVAPDKAVVSDEDVSAKTATHTSATDVSKTKEVLAERAQEAQKQQEVLKDKQATKEERLENKQDKQVKEEQVVQEEFVATMQARAQKAEIAVEQAALRAIQAQNTAPGGGHIDEDGGSVNQFSRLYQNTLSEQKTEQARVLGSSQVNTVGDTNIKATGTTIASNTTQNTEEANQNAPQNQVTGNRTHTVGTTTVEQANRLLGAGDASTNAPTPQTQAHSAQGTQGAALTQGAQGSAAQTQSQSQTQGTVQGQAPAPSTNAPSAQGQTPAQGSVPTPNTTTSPNTPTTNQNVQSAAPSTSSANPSVGSVAGTQSVEGAANKGMMPMPNMSAPVINLDEDSLQDEIIKNVMQTVPSDEFEEFNLKNGPLGNQALSGVIADTDLTEDNNSFNQILNKSQGITNNMLSSLSDPATVIPTTSAVGASQITSGENAPIPEESVVNNINTPKEGGFFRRLASLFGRKEESAPVASENIDKSVDPSKVALEKGIGQSEGTTKAQESAVAIANLRTNSLDALVSRLQSATTDQALPPKMQEQAQNLIKALQNPVHDLKTVSSWLNFVTGPMSPSSSQAMALHQWAFMLLCIRFEQIGKNVDKFLKKTANGDQKLASLEPAIKEHAKLTKELDEVSVNKSHELLKETFGQVERMQQQMQSIPQDQSVLRYIPLPPNYQGGKEGSFSAQKRQDEDGGTSWHLNFNLDLENLGGLQVKVKLRFPEIQMSFVAEKFETLQKVQAHMPELNARLKEIGLTSKGSNARLGAVNFMQPSKESSKSKFKFEGNAFNVDA